MRTWSKVRKQVEGDRYTNEMKPETNTRCIEERKENLFLNAMSEFSEKVGRKVTPDEAEAIKSVIEQQ